MNSDHYTQQLEHVYDGLKGLGLMPDQLSKFKETSDKVIKTATVQSLVAKAGVDINQGSTEAMDRAIGLMSSDEYKQGLDKDTYQGLIKTVVEANDKIGLQAISQSDTAGAQKLITAGQALPNIPGVKTAADQAFMNFYSKSIVPQVTGNGIKDPISIGSTIKNYIGQNGIIGPQMKNMIENTIGNSKDPTQVAAMAQGLYQAVREGGVSASTLAKEVSPGTFKQALAIADAMNSGADYKSAVIDVRTAQLNIAQNPSLQKGMEKIIQNEDVNNLAKQAANKWFEPTVNDPAMQASIKSLFKTEYAASDGDKATAEANTVQKLSKAGAMTDVNGSKEFMFGAPEMFWQGAELSQAKQLISDKLVDVGQKVLGKELGDEGKAGIVYGSGIKFSDGTQLGIQSVPGVTLFQPNNNKTYQVWDMKANTPVLDRQGLPVRFSVNTDLTQVGKDRQAAIDTYNKQREDLNQKIKDRNNLVETTLGWK